MIKFITMEGQIEESAGRRKFYLSLEKTILYYEKKMLCDSECPYTLPMFFLAEGSAETAYYDFTGYIQAGDYIKNIKESMGRENSKLINSALDLLAGILDCIKGMEDYLLYSERFSFHIDAIFIHGNTGRVAFAYFPNEKAELPLQHRMLQLIEVMNDLYGDTETEQYLKKFIGLIEHKNLGLDGMISMLGTIQREVNYIYWNATDMRETEEKETLIMPEVSIPHHIKNVRWKPFMIQGVFAAGLVAVFLTERLEVTSFAGLTILAAGLDLWIMKRFFSTK